MLRRPCRGARRTWLVVAAVLAGACFPALDHLSGGDASVADAGPTDASSGDSSAADAPTDSGTDAPTVPPEAGDGATDAASSVAMLGTPYPWAIVGLSTDGTSLYWVGIDATMETHVMQSPLDGGTAISLAGPGVTAPGTAAVVSDGSDVFFRAGQSIVRVPVGGGAPTSVASHPTGAGLGIAVDEESIYFGASEGDAGQTALWSVSKDGGAPAIAAYTGMYPPLAVATVGGDVAFVSNANGNQVGYIEAGGSTPTTPTSISDQYTPSASTSLATNDAGVLWVTKTSAGLAYASSAWVPYAPVPTLSLDGGASPTPQGVAMDAVNLYATVGYPGDGGPCGDGRVLEIAITGPGTFGPPVPIVPSFDCPTGIVAVGDMVYFVAHSGTDQAIFHVLR